MLLWLLHDEFQTVYMNQQVGNTKAQAYQMLRSGRAMEAKALLEKVCKLHKKDAEAWMLLGCVHGTLHDVSASIKCLHKAVSLRPTIAEAHGNLGIALKTAGKLNEAVESYRRAIELKPDSAGVYNNLGNALVEQGKFDEAIACFKRAVALRPNFADVYFNLGCALRDRGLLEKDAGRLDDAVKSFQTAVRLKPDFAEGHYNLGATLAHIDEFTKAEACYRKALHIKPEYAEAYGNLANIFLFQGRLDEAEKSYRKTLNIKSDYVGAHSNLLLCLNYSDGDAAAVFAEHCRWAEVHGVFEPPVQYSNIPEPDRRLRIGYVSPDLWTHPVAFFLEALLANHDPDAVESFCYAEVKRPDAMTERLRSLAGAWRDIHGKPDDEVADMIRLDGIDILIDLAGHMANNRLLVFARKPAPVQVTYLGYPNTTGLPAMDYRLTDNLADPVDSSGRYTEELVRLPNCFLCYLPPRETPPVSPLPAETVGHITFGSFNNLAKVTPTVVAHWASILQAVPDSRLILKSKALRDKTACERYRALFADHGISNERIELIGWTTSIEEHMGLYNRVDIALDTFPYNGTTTTCDALWMGVPVIVLAGSQHAGRVGVSLLGATELTELIADTLDGYRQLAITLANDVDRLAEMRQHLRTKLSASPLCDGPQFARDVEQAYRDMWRQWCRNA